MCIRLINCIPAHVHLAVFSVRRPHTCEFNTARQLEHGCPIPVVESTTDHHVDQSGVQIDGVVHEQSIQSSLHAAQCVAILHYIL